MKTFSILSLAFFYFINTIGFCHNLPLPIAIDSPGEEIKVTIENALSALLKEGRHFSISNISVDGNNATGSMELFKTNTAFSLDFISPTQLNTLTITFNTPQDIPDRFVKRFLDSGISNLLPNSIPKPDITSFLIDFNGSSSIYSIAAVVKKNEWRPIKESPLKASNIEFLVKNNTPLAKNGTIEAKVSGKLDIDGITAALTGSGNSSKNWKVTGSSENLSIGNLMQTIASGLMNGIHLPPGFQSLKISSMDFVIDEGQRKFVANGKTSIGNIGARFIGDGKNGNYMLGISPPNDFKYASLDGNLSILDKLEFEKSALVLSSDQRVADIYVIKNLAGGQVVNRGLNLIANYNISSLSPELANLIGQTNLRLLATIGNKASDLFLSTALKTNINLDGKGNVVFKQIEFKLRPANLTVEMDGLIDTKIGGDLLSFSSGAKIDIDALSLTVNGQLKGTWSNPFNLNKGLHIKDLGLEIGASLRTLPLPIPSLAFQGTLVAGNLNNPTFQGRVVVGVIPYDPINSMIDAEFNSLSLGQVVSAFSGNAEIPAEIKGVLDRAKLTNVQVTVVPNPNGVTLFDKTYDPGFLVKGSAEIEGITANLMIKVGPDSGVEAKASIDAINFDPIFSLKGVDGPNPYIHIYIKPGAASKLSVSGSATLLGITSTTDMHIRTNGIDLLMSGNIFNAFKADLEIHANAAKERSSYYVKASLKNDLFSYITKEASEEIDRATKQTQNDIKKAQNDVRGAQQEVAKLENDINAQRRIVEQERERDLGRLRAAQQEVSNARAEVQKVQNNINNAHNEIRNIDNRIATKRRWVDGGGDPFTITARGVEAAPYFTKQALERSGQMAYIASLESGKFIADKALLVAEKSVEGFHYLGNLTPIDMDPRVAGLIGLKETAIGSMEASIYIMEGGSIVGVGTLKATKWIVENANPLGVVNVTFASFEGGLNGVSGGNVKLRLKGTFAGSPFDSKFDFNFNNPLQSAKNVANTLLNM